MLPHTVLLTWVVALLGTATAGSNVTVQQGAPLGLSHISGSEPGTYTYREPAGEGVYIYMPSTGIDRDHPDFGGRVEPGYDATEMGLVDVGEQDEQWRLSGTHLASTAAGATYGVAKRATIVDVKVLREPTETFWRIDTHTIDAAQRGIYWAVDDIVAKRRMGKAVISIPWAYRWDMYCDRPERLWPVLPCHLGRELSPPLRRARNLNVPIVMAAGDSSYTALRYFPGMLDLGVTVGAVDEDNRRWKHFVETSDELILGSNFGHPVEIFAPGYAIAAVPGNEEQGPNATKGWQGGTKTAAAYVTGVVALMLTEERFARSSMTHFFSALYETAIPDVIINSKTRRSRLLYNGGQDGFKAAPRYQGGSRGRFPSQRKKVGTWQ